MVLDLLPIILVISSFAVAIYLSIQEEKTRKKLRNQEETQKQKIYQLSTLREIQDRIGYSLDVEKIIDVITGSLKVLFPYSSASAFILRENGAVFKTYVEESVSHDFLSQVKESMLASLSALLGEKPKIIDEQISGVPLDDINTATLSSFFHIPIVLNNRAVGLINVSSTRPGLYKEEEMTILYQIAKQASEALSKLEEVLEIEKGKLMSLIGSLVDGVFMIDSEQKLVVINEAAKKFLGLSQKDASYLDIAGALPPEIKLSQWVSQSLKDKKMIFQKNVSLGRRVFEVLVIPAQRSALIGSSSTSPTGVSVVLHDVTIEKSLEKMKEDFTNMIVHELRAPLTNIKGSAELLMQEANLSSEEKTKFINIIGNQSRTLLDQVGEILDAAKIENKKFTLNKETGDIVSLIKKQLDIFIPQLGKKNISLDFNAAREIPKFSFDALRISQVINNLVSNSLKFTPDGGTITISAVVRGVARLEGVPSSDRREPATEDVGRDEGATGPREIVISVSDTGIGIPQDKQKDLFEKYIQAGGMPRDLAGKGTGLGLYLTRAIVEAHGGQIRLESQPGTGTKITFTLPIGATTEQPDHPQLTEHLSN